MSMDSGMENLQNSNENLQNEQSFLKTKVALGKLFLKRIADTSKALNENEEIKSNYQKLLEIQKRDLILTGLIASKFVKLDGIKGEILKKGTEVAAEHAAKDKIDLHPDVPDWFMEISQKVGIIYSNALMAPHVLQIGIDRTYNSFVVNKEMLSTSIKVVKENLFDKPKEINDQVDKSSLKFKDKK